jgi:TolB-like protein/tetratricopeptide (TPR) repeat protein
MVRNSASVTESSKGVFLSYASEDAGAAKRICDALRVAGIEVWFDQSELRGGDAWDLKIRQQIRDCALFVPIISAHTQERPEGYFRLEWKLAVDRSHLMAAEKAFLVPVVVDATTEPEALVPAQFREVQWTRIRADEVPAAFVDRIATLLHQRVATRLDRTERAVTSAHPRRLPVVLIALSISAVVALVIATAVRGGLSSNKFASKVEVGAPSASVTTTPVAIPEKSIAVLPFADMSEKSDQGYFSDGIAEELLDLLAQVPDLKVTSRTSSFYFKGKPTPLSEIAKTLGVAHILEGSVRKSGHTIRVTAQLIRADNGFHLWSKTYDREFNDVFKVQDEIAGAVVGALKVQLMRGNSSQLEHKDTTTPEAYQQYLLGKQLYNMGEDEADLRAISALRQVTRLDPSYLPGWTLLARAVGDHATFVEDDPAALLRELDEAAAAAETAVRLAPTRGDGYAARCRVLSWRLKVREARQDCRRAVELEPEDRDAQRSAAVLGQFMGGDTAPLIALYRRETVEDPLNPSAWMDFARALAESDLAAAVAANEHALQISPKRAGAAMRLSNFYLRQGKADLALEAARREANEAYRLYAVALAELALGRRADAAAHRDELITKYASTGAYQVAEVYAISGDKARALDWLERAYRQTDGGLTSALVNTSLQSLHGEPRYEALMKKIGLKD